MVYQHSQIRWSVAVLPINYRTETMQLLPPVPYQKSF
jgi:hypothetical protein